MRVSKILVLIWRRRVELKKKPADFFVAVLGSILLLAEMYFLYSVPPTRPAGSLEAFLFPILVTTVPQKLLTTVMADKSGLLIEHMRLMGLNWSSYWISNFLL
jgi:hypothetical protein